MAKLTTKARKKLKKSSFVFPAKRAYPIEDPNHARNALARVSQFGTPAEQATVKAAVHKKYPSIGKPKKRAKYNYSGPTLMNKAIAKVKKKVKGK
jgi:hypothetical protein